MPDDADPAQPDHDAVPGDGDVPVDEGEATQAVPVGELGLFGDTEATATTAAGDATQAVPRGAGTGDETPPVGTPATPGTGDSGGTHHVNRALVIGSVVAAVLLVAAGIALAVSGTGPRPDTSTGPRPTTPATEPGPPCPLTGAPAAGTQVPQRPALAVKVDNYPQARPQSGLDKADIVFEEPVEGGITRLVAVFQCQSPTLVGPIRSARAVDVPILGQLSRPLFLHVGGINPVLSLLQGGNLIDENLFYHGPIIQTVPGRQAPYDTYVSAAAGWGLDPNDTTPPAALFTYSDSAPAGSPVATVNIPFGSTNDTVWTWDAKSGRWLLSYGGTPATVSGAGQIATSNIVVQTVRVTYGPWLENDVGGLEVQSQLVGSGPVTVLRDGVAVTGTWHRASSVDPTTLTAADGSTIALRPGPTWVELVPSAVAFTTTAPHTTATTAH